MKREHNDIWGRTLDEIDKAASLVSIFLIMQGNRIAGRITGRWTKNGVLHLAFIFYATNDYGLPIYGYTTLNGYGYDKENTGIAEILYDCKDKLREAYGVQLEGRNLLNTWSKDFEAAGFSVIRAL